MLDFFPYLFLSEDQKFQIFCVFKALNNPQKCNGALTRYLEKCYMENVGVFCIL
jgi:hypothetical protein